MRLERIDTIFDFEKGTLQSTKCEPGDFDFITASRDWKSHSTFTHEKEALVIAVAASGSLGRTHYVNGKFIASDLCFILTPKGEYANSISLPFYHFVFNGLKEDIVKQCASGTAKQAINQQNFANYRIPYFETDEQDRMALRLKAAFASQESLEHEITHQQSLLAKLKQAILQEAIQGKLTADWRAVHPDVEPASQLLRRIQAEKARLIAAKKLRPEKPLPVVAAKEIPFEIPAGWEWSRLGSIALHSLGKMLDKGKNKGNALPYLRNLNVRWYGVELSDLKTMPFEDHELEKYSVRRGDVLICEGGHGIGRAAVWDSEQTVMFQKALHRVRFIGGFYEPTLFVHFLRLSEMTGHIANYFTGAGIPHFTGDKIHKMAIPIPPLAEQAAIVERVEALMTTCRALEAEIEQSRTHAAHLLQAVLKEAFAPAS